MLPARLLLPGCLRFPRPPSLFPHSPTSLTFRNEVKLNFHCQNLAPRRQASTNLFPSAVVFDTSLCVCRTAFSWSQRQLQQRERQWQRAYQRRPTALETQEKTTETEAHSSLATVYACTASRQPIPGKIWIPANQIRERSAHAHVSRELRTRAL